MTVGKGRGVPQAVLEVSRGGELSGPVGLHGGYDSEDSVLSISSAIGWMIGTATLFAGLKGMCVVLHGRHQRHVRPWELWGDSDSQSERKYSTDSLDTESTRNSYEDEVRLCGFKFEIKHANVCNSLGWKSIANATSSERSLTASCGLRSPFSGKSKTQSPCRLFARQRWPRCCFRRCFLQSRAAVSFRHCRIRLGYFLWVFRDRSLFWVGMHYGVHLFVHAAREAGCLGTSRRDVIANICAYALASLF